MKSLPDPLVPPEVDLRCFDSMPLNVKRLLSSTTAKILTDAEFRAAITLWCESWHQVPASSLPSDERELCALAGLGRDTASWAAVRDGALRHYVLCKDGRLYHPVVAEMALKSWESVYANIKRTTAARAALAEKHKLGKDAAKVTFKPTRRVLSVDNESVIDAVTKSVTDAIAENVTSFVTVPLTIPKIENINSKSSDSEPSGSESCSTPPLDRLSLSEGFLGFYAAYPKHTGKLAAESKFKIALRRGADAEKIIAAARRFREACEAAGTTKQFIPAPAAWLHQGRYEDEDLPQAQEGPTNAYFEVERQRRSHEHDDSDDPGVLDADSLDGEASGYDPAAFEPLP